MTARHLAITAILLLGIPRADAQDAAPTPRQNPVLDVIRKFNPPTAATATELTTDGDPAVEKPVPPASQATPPAEALDTAPVAEATAAPTLTTPAAATPRQGLAVRVDTIQTGTGNIDPSQVELQEPFPAKPLAQPPAGWRLKSLPTVPPFTREVELVPGKKITLTIRPDILVPDADGTTVFSVPEPGYDAALGYRQLATVGSILTHSIGHLDDDAQTLGTAIDQLQQILVSLPKPEPQTAPQPEPQTVAPALTKPKLKPKPAPKPPTQPAPAPPR